MWFWFEKSRQQIKKCSPILHPGQWKNVVIHGNVLPFIHTIKHIAVVSNHAKCTQTDTHTLFYQHWRVIVERGHWLSHKRGICACGAAKVTQFLSLHCGTNIEISVESMASARCPLDSMLPLRLARKSLFCVSLAQVESQETDENGQMFL